MSLAARTFLPALLFFAACSESDSDPQGSEEPDNRAGTGNGAAAGGDGTPGSGGNSGAVAGGTPGSVTGGRADVGGGAGSPDTGGSATTGGAQNTALGGASSSGGSAGAARGGASGDGGRGGEIASAGEAGFGGEGGKSKPGACTNPFGAIDFSRLEADEELEPYSVSGQTAAEIRRSINQTRGMDYDALTNWYISWQFGDCEGNGLAITLDITYRYPEWEPPASASAALVTSWETYMDALFCHEYGHAKNGIDAANAAYDALSAIDAGGDCDAQQTRAEAAFDVVLTTYQERDLQYDADTQHGATMGAVFPP
jgi:predicted secreted Zn-dependent protease